MSDIRVLECGEGVSAPFCARVLADLGAEVIKIESPDGDPTRLWGPFPADRADPEHGAIFAYLNAGKKSVRLSGDPDADRALISSLAASTDVVATNLSVDRQEEWGIDSSSLDSAGTDLVQVRLSRYGLFGPDADAPAKEINVCAAGGISIILGEPDRPPLSFPFAVAALQCGLHGAAAALTALLARRRGAAGQAIDIAETDVLAYYAGGMSLFIRGGGGRWTRRGFERHGAIYPSGFYPCKDGYIFMATQTRRQWKGFLRLMGDPDWAAQDPDLQDGTAIGWKRADEVDTHFIPWLVQFTRRELTEMARKADLVLGPINETADLLDQPHLEAREFWHPIQRGGRSLRLPGMGYTMSATPARLGPVPRLGEHQSSVPEPRAASSSREAETSSGEGRTSSGPLAGYRAVEFGWNWAGPMVGQILADMGMEIIKIETQGRLDFMRHWPHARAFFHNANRGKLSVSINIKAAGGVDLVRRLVGKSDIIFDNFAAGVLARNGLDYESLRAAKPDIIAMSMAMAGQNGPLHHLRGFATIATGFSGLEAAIGYPDRGPTGLPSIGLGDANAAIQAVTACLAALWHRERTGEGQFIDLSQIEAAAALAGQPLSEAQWGEPDRAPRGNFHPAMAPHGIYPTAGDDRWISLAVEDDAQWRELVREMGAPDWTSDPALQHRDGRLAKRSELDERVAEWTRNVERDVLVARLRAAGLATAPVLEIDEMNEAPQLTARGLCEEIESFEGEPKLIYNTPWHLSRTPRHVGLPSPRIGQHNEQVLHGLLGMARAETDALAETKVIW